MFEKIVSTWQFERFLFKPILLFQFVSHDLKQILQQICLDIPNRIYQMNICYYYKFRQTLDLKINPLVIICQSTSMQASTLNKNNYRLEHPLKRSIISQSTSKNNSKQHTNKQNVTSPLTPLKLNSNKLPNDFFKKPSKIPPLPPKTKLSKRTKPKAETYRKDHNKSEQSHNISEFIPQAENTCYFKMQGSLQFYSIAASPPHNKYSSSTKNISQKRLQRLGGSDEINLFINNKTERSAHQKDQFLYTFSRESEDLKNRTPLKQNNSIHNTINTTKTTSKNYLSMERQSNLCQLQNISRRYKLRDMGQSKEMKTAKKYTGQKKVNRIYEQIVLPKIHTNQRQ